MNELDFDEHMMKKIVPVCERAVQKLVDTKRDELERIFESSTYDYKKSDKELNKAKKKLAKLVNDRRMQKTKSKEVENVNSKTLVNEKKKSEPFFRL